MANPNGYNDEQYTRGSAQLSNAVGMLWEAGTTEAQLVEMFRQAAENCDGIDMDEFDAEVGR